jgi:acyl carrier protein
MNMSETAARTIQIIADYLGVDPADIAVEASFADDLEMDSLAKMELVIAFEEAFSIEVSDDMLDQILTVGDAINVIETAQGQLNPVNTP